jgi:beta-phosphoglucomutase
MFNAVIFDFDGVILDSEPLHYEACMLVLNNIGLAMTYTEYAQHYIGLADKEMFPKLLQNKGYVISSEHMADFIMQKVKLYKQLINNHPTLPLITGIANYLHYLKKQHIKTAICSGSAREEINAVLEKANNGELQQYFNIIVSSEDVQFGKPSPEGYLLASQKLNIAPDKCLVIEDTPHGIDAAQSAGMTTVALLTTHTKDQLQKAHKIVGDFSEILR